VPQAYASDSEAEEKRGGLYSMTAVRDDVTIASDRKLSLTANESRAAIFVGGDLAALPSFALSNGRRTAPPNG
jgi:hypothetical protein